MMNGNLFAFCSTMEDLLTNHAFYSNLTFLTKHVMKQYTTLTGRINLFKYVLVIKF